jgi:hypothetical protein
MDKTESVNFLKLTESAAQAPFNAANIFESVGNQPIKKGLDFDLGKGVDFSEAFKLGNKGAVQEKATTIAKDASLPTVSPDKSAAAATEKNAAPDGKPGTAAVDLGSMRLPDLNPGYIKMQDFFNSSAAQALKDKNGKLDLSSVKSLNANALKEGRTADYQVGSFVEKNFKELAGLNRDSAIFSDKKISASDLKSIPTYDALLDTGAMPERFDPRYNRAFQIGGALVGAALGTALQLGIEHVPGGRLIEKGGMALGNTLFSPAGAFGGYLAGQELSRGITGDEKGLLHYPLTVGGVFAGGALGLTLGSRAWGPTLGAALGLYIVSGHGDKFLPSTAANNYKRFSSEISKIQ